MTKAQTTDILSIAEQIGTTDSELTALLVEQERLPGLLRQAAHDADADEIVRLRRRADDLPAHIFSSRVRLLRLQVLNMESQVPPLDEARHAAQAASAVTEQALTHAREAHNRTSALAANALEQYRSANIDLSERRRQLQALLNEYQRESRHARPTV